MHELVLLVLSTYILDWYGPIWRLKSRPSYEYFMLGIHVEWYIYIY